MATPYMILQMVLFLNHAIQELNYKKMMPWINSTSLQILLKIDLKKAKTAKLGYMS